MIGEMMKDKESEGQDLVVSLKKEAQETKVMMEGGRRVNGVTQVMLKLEEIKEEISKTELKILTLPSASMLPLDQLEWIVHK